MGVFLLCGGVAFVPLSCMMSMRASAKQYDAIRAKAKSGTMSGEEFASHINIGDSQWHVNSSMGNPFIHGQAPWGSDDYAVSDGTLEIFYDRDAEVSRIQIRPHLNDSNNIRVLK